MTAQAGLGGNDRPPPGSRPVVRRSATVHRVDDSRSASDGQVIGAARRWLTPDGVAQVVLTHAHHDHIGGLPVFGAAEVIMTRSEYEFWTGPMGGREQFAHSVEAGFR